MATKVTGWFPHDIDAIHDVAIQMLVDEHGANGYGIWWRMVELLHEHNGKVKGDHLIFLLYRSLGSEIDTVAEVIDTSVAVGLLQRDEECIWSERVLRNIEQRNDIMGKRSESGRRGGMAKASKALANAKQMPSKSQASAKQVPSKPLANSSTYTVTDTVTDTKKKNTPLPPETGGVLDYPEFHSAWEEWARHRRDLKKPITESTAKRQLAKLEAIKTKGGDPVAWINNAIEKGWRGLFAPQDKPKLDDVIAWFEKHYARNEAEAQALKFYGRHDAVNWRVAGQDVTNWKALAVTWKENNP